jgi:hypothetical protein
MIGPEIFDILFDMLMQTNLEDESFIEFSPTSGKMMDHSPTETPFPHRSQKFGLFDFAIVGKTYESFLKNKNIIYDKYVKLIAPFVTVNYSYKGKQYKYPTIRRDSPFYGGYDQW